MFLLCVAACSLFSVSCFVSCSASSIFRSLLSFLRKVYVCFCMRLLCFAVCSLFSVLSLFFVRFCFVSQCVSYFLFYVLFSAMFLLCFTCFIFFWILFFVLCYIHFMFLLIFCLRLNCVMCWLFVSVMFPFYVFFFGFFLVSDENMLCVWSMFDMLVFCRFFLCFHFVCNHVSV